MEAKTWRRLLGRTGSPCGIVLVQTTAEERAWNGSAVAAVGSGAGTGGDGPNARSAAGSRTQNVF